MIADRLLGRVALVTGAAGGLGRATARRLAQEGAAVLMTDLRSDEVATAARDIAAEGGRALALGHDVGDSASWATAVETAVAELGRLDVLVNNAGVGHRASIDELAEEDYVRVVRVTQSSVYLGMQHAAPALKASGHGAVVNISSICGTTGTSGASFAYHAAKGAVTNMTRNAALCWAVDGVRVNSVHPGYIRT
ncbi:SDR family NAD(P)-dependent oxidoreductase, partial [Streptomyces sp. NPDC055078]